MASIYVYFVNPIVPFSFVPNIFQSSYVVSYYPITTRSKVGIFKPTPLSVYLYQTKPSTTKQALGHVGWR